MTDLLRNRIGFKGVVITDDIQMAGAGLIEDVRERAIRAVEAGGDMIMITWNRKTQASVSQALIKAVQSGRLTEDRINESVRRILAAKREYAPPEKKSSVEQLRLALKSPEFQSVADEAVNSIFKRELTAEEKKYVDYAADKPILIFSANKNFVKSFREAADDRKVRSFTLSSQQSFDIDKVMRSNPESTAVFYMTGPQIAKIASKISEDVAARMLVVTVEPPGLLKNADDFRHIAEIYYRHPQLGKMIAERFFQTPAEVREVASVPKPSKKKTTKASGI